MKKFPLAPTLVLLLRSSYAHAYLDPGSASIIFQVIIGSILTASMTFKLWWHRVKGIFNSLSGGAKVDDSSESENE